jgi:hypothetical protein
MELFLLLFHLFFALLPLVWSEYPKGKWNDPNLVLQNGKWRVMPDPDPNAPKPHPPYDLKHTQNDTTIIVLIASFRETRCKDTLFNFMTQATFPQRVYIGVVQQNEITDPDCFFEYCKRMDKQYNYTNMPNKQRNLYMTNVTLPREGDSGTSVSIMCPFGANIKMLRMHASEAKGPVYARAQQVKLVGDEDFCMQIDAHTEVAKDWDVRMLLEWGRYIYRYIHLSIYIGNRPKKSWAISDIGPSPLISPVFCGAKPRETRGDIGGGD